MKKYISISLILTLSFGLSFLASPEIIKLKNNDVIEAEIIERTDEYIRIDFQGVGITYYIEDIESIDGEKISLSSEEEILTFETKEPLTGDSLDYLKKGDRYLDRRQYRQAIKEFQKALQIEPYNVQAYYKLATTYNSMGQPQQAITYLKKIIEIKPNDANAHSSIAFTYSFLGQFREARECFEKAIQIDPNFAQAYFGLGLAYLDSARYDKGIENLKKAKELFQAQGDIKGAQRVELYLRKKFPEATLEEEVFDIE